MLKFDMAELERRKARLESVKAKLKKDFIGIDDIIDSLINYIQIWYFMPELLERPIIVNLWGMTGVGKTDLVRRMVKYLDFQDRFAEVELSNTDTTSWRNSVSDILETNLLNNGKPAIVLFDEIQRFNTLDEKGLPLPTSKFIDFWELLSDGRLAKKSKEDFDTYISSLIFNQREHKRRKEKGEEMEKDSAFTQYWDVQQVQKFMGTGKDILEFAALSPKELLDYLLAERNKKEIFEPINHSQTLILISGNLDEAFTMADQASEADIDADIFHAYTSKITMVDVKNALSQKFRPEQVARFGNIHLIYPSLKKSDFEKLIAVEIKKIIQKTKKRVGITLTIDKSIHGLVYRNGVFPVQGVRPVFSSLIDILESNLSNYIFKSLTDNTKYINIKYNVKQKRIEALIGKEIIVTPYIGRIDKIRERNVEDTIANISVHEAGHAVAYMVLFGLAPLQLKSKVASSTAGGFTFPHDIYNTKENLIKKIQVYLAGGLAEDLIFGAENASNGRVGDREKVTMLTVDFVRRYGFTEDFSATYTMSEAYTMNRKVTDKIIETMIKQLCAQTMELLSNQRPLLVALSTELCLKGDIPSVDIAKIAKKHQLPVLQKEEGALHVFNYKAALDKKKT